MVPCPTCCQLGTVEDIIRDLDDKIASPEASRQAKNPLKLFLPLMALFGHVPGSGQLEGGF